MVSIRMCKYAFNYHFSSASPYDLSVCAQCYKTFVLVQCFNLTYETNRLFQCSSMVWCLVKGNKSHGTVEQILWPPRNLFLSHLIDVVFNSFIQVIEILRCSIPIVNFITHAISKNLQCSVSLFVNLFLSVPLSRSSASPGSIFTCPSFNINRNLICVWSSLNKLTWMNTVFHLRFAHNTIIFIRVVTFLSSPTNIRVG